MYERNSFATLIFFFTLIYSIHERLIYALVFCFLYAGLSNNRFWIV